MSILEDRLRFTAAIAAIAPLLLVAFVTACAGQRDEGTTPDVPPPTTDGGLLDATPPPAPDDGSSTPMTDLVAPPFLLVLRKGPIEDALLLVSEKDRSIHAKLPTGDDPHEVLVTKDGSRAYVSDYGPKEAPGSTLTIIDLKTQKAQKTVDLGDLRRPHGLAEANGAIYFTSEATQSVGRYDPAADKVDWTAHVGQSLTHMIVATADGKKLYTADIGSDTVSAVDAETGAVTHIAVGKGPEGIAISPNGQEVWAAHRGDGGVSVIDTATDTVAATLPCGKLPIRAAFTPDGSRVLISDPVAGELVIFDAAARQVIARVPLAGGAMALAVAPDSKRAFVAAIEKGSVIAVDLTKNEVEAEPLIQGIGELPDGIAWVP